ncbi:MAG: S49 family peptidase [Pseudomonadota bacterium]
MADADQPNDPNFESRFVNRLAAEFLKEQRRNRRWGVFFKFLVFAYLAAILILANPKWVKEASFGEDNFTALIDLQGIIAHGSDASADNVVAGLRAAFKDEKTAGIILRINSPGGSPVQAGYINDEIYRLKAKYPETPLYAVVEDICASGGYYVAVAADKIFADKASIIGSIGVRMDGFGFVETMKKLGVERRLLTAGENKAFLDPFSPLKEEEVGHVQQLLADIHEQFINTVVKGRREIISEDQEIYSGLLWTGEQSLALGLVDELGSSGYVAREIIGEEKIVDFTKKDLTFEGFAKRFGSQVLQTALSELSMRLF